jgi:hypothetical protein
MNPSAGKRTFLFSCPARVTKYSSFVSLNNR